MANIAEDKGTKAPPRKSPRVVRGIVVSDKMNKTRLIRIDRAKTHNLYLKKKRLSTRLLIHDEKNESKKGDRVAAIMCRPLSKNKAFRLKQILQQGTTV